MLALQCVYPGMQHYLLVPHFLLQLPKAPVCLSLVLGCGTRAQRRFGPLGLFSKLFLSSLAWTSSGGWLEKDHPMYSFARIPLNSRDECGLCTNERIYLDINMRQAIEWLSGLLEIIMVAQWTQAVLAIVLSGEMKAAISSRVMCSNPLKFNNI